MARIYKRTGRYYVDYRDPAGRRVRRSLGITTKAAAEAARARLELELAQGRAPGTTDLSLADVVNDYLSYTARRNKPSTVAMRRVYFRRFLDAVGDVAAVAVTRDMVERYVTRRIADANAPTVNRELAALKTLFNYAQDHDVVAVNPCRGVKRRPEKRNPPRILTTEERRRWFAWCKKNDPLLYDLSTVAFYTGLRRGDLVKIRGADVQDGRLTVVVSKRGGELVQYIPLAAAAAEVLNRRKNGADYIFPGRDGPHYLRFDKRVNAARRATGLRDFTFRDFRHNFATALVEAGVDIYVVQQLLGHTTVVTTQRYARVVAPLLADAVKRLP